jgi:hypothetical protein
LVFECRGDIPLPFTSYSEFLAAGGIASDNCGLDTLTYAMVENR